MSKKLSSVVDESKLQINSNNDIWNFDRLLKNGIIMSLCLEDEIICFSTKEKKLCLIKPVLLEDGWSYNISDLDFMNQIPFDMRKKVNIPFGVGLMMFVNNTKKNKDVFSEMFKN